MGRPISSLYLACPDCDGLYTAPEIPVGDRVVCPRCGAHLVTERADFVSRAAALVLAAALFFVLANLFPFMTLKADYRESDMLLVGSVTGLQQQGFPILASSTDLCRSRLTSGGRGIRSARSRYRSAASKLPSRSSSSAR